MFWKLFWIPTGFACKEGTGFNRYLFGSTGIFFYLVGMERKSFFKSLLGLIVAPKLISKINFESPEMKMAKIKRDFKGPPSGHRIDLDKIREYPMTPEECLNWFNQTGNIYGYNPLTS